MEGTSPEIHRWGKIWGLAARSEFAGASAALLEMSGPNDPQPTEKATRFYYVLEGSGKIITSNREYPIEKGTFLKVAPKTVHHIAPSPGKKLTLIVFSTPAYSDKDTIYQKSSL